MESTQGKVLGLFSAPGGVGKTTIAALTAWFAREAGSRVLAIDMDPSISLSWLIVRDERTLYEREKMRKTLSEMLVKIAVKQEPVNLPEYTLARPFPSSKDLELEALVPDLELINVINNLWFGFRARREYLLSDFLEALEVRRIYGLTVVDTIPFYDMKYAVLTLYAADRCLIPLRPTVIDTYRTTMMLKQLPVVAGIPAEEITSKVALMFNMVRRKTKQAENLDRYASYVKMQVSPKLKVFSAYLPYKVSFSRIGTEEEQQGDREDVKKEFTAFFEEFKEWIKG